MSKSKMRKVLESVLAMPYYKNHAAASGRVHNDPKHEDAYEDILIQNGYTRSRISKVSKRHRDELLRTGEYPEMEDNSYIPQPCGKQDSPDFLVKSEGLLFFIECKSASGPTTAPMYNSAVPKSGYIYVFCCKKYDETTTYLGQDVLERDDQQLIEAHIEEARRRDEELNNSLREGGHSHGIEYYTRPMMTHTKHGVCKDYFRHPRREQLEQNVLNYV